MVQTNRAGRNLHDAREMTMARDEYDHLRESADSGDVDRVYRDAHGNMWDTNGDGGWTRRDQPLVLGREAPTMIVVPPPPAPAPPPARTSLGRLIVTPILLIVAGYLVAGLAGAAIGGVVGIAYVVFASFR